MMLSAIRGEVSTRGAAIDRVSAGFTINPNLPLSSQRIPGASIAIHPNNQLSRVSAAEAREMSVEDTIARSQSTLAVVSSMSDPEQILKVLEQATQPDSALNVRIRVQEERVSDLQSQLRDAQARGDRRLEEAILNTMLEAMDQCDLLRREREKADLLRRLLSALACGIIPMELIQRMKDLGMGDIVATIIEQVVGSGRSQSRAFAQACAMLRTMGINVHTVDAAFTIEAETIEDARLAAFAVNASDGRVVDARGRSIAPSDASTSVARNGFGLLASRREAGYAVNR
jgi:hypothetical protein